MSKESSSRSNSLNSNKKKYQFDVVIMGNYENTETLFLNTFPIEDNNSSNIKYRYKYLNRCNLILRETIKFPQHFEIAYQPELMDKLNNIDILILVYTATDELSFEYLKTFYYLYYLQIEEQNRPKNIILIERDYSLDNEIYYAKKVDVNSAKNLTKLFNGYFCDYETNENDLNLILKEQLEKLFIKYNYIEDYNLFKSKENNNEVSCFINFYGDKESQEKFVALLMSKCNFDLSKGYNSNLYEVYYETTIKGNKTKYKLTLKLIGIEYSYDSECNILLYDVNKNESYNFIKNKIRQLIENNDSKSKKIYNLIALNYNEKKIQDNEENENIKKGENLASEIGANISFLNINENNRNLDKELKNKFDNILEQIIDCINMSKSNKFSEDNKNKNLSFEFENDEVFFEFEEVKDISFVKEIKNKIKKDINNNHSCLFNICQNCHSQLNIRIDEISNIVIVYCNKCKNEPMGINADQLFEENKKEKKIFFAQNVRIFLIMI